MPTTMTSKGQVTIPKRVRDRLGLKAGSKVEFDVNEAGYVVIRPANDDKPPANPFEKWVGFAGPGPSTDEIMRLMRGTDEDDVL